MNERIRELAKEALEYAEKNQSAEVQQHWFKLYNEKFAELIVKETLQVARAGIEFGDGMEDAVYKYFGVEE